MTTTAHPLDLITRDACTGVDAADSLAPFRNRFILPEGVIYLDGNSLGARPVGAVERAQQLIAEEWGEGLIRSWNTAGWFELPRRLGDKLAKLIGGRDGETVVIVTERDIFPTDIYLAEGVTDFLNSVAAETGVRYEVPLIDEELPLDAALDSSTAVLALSHVNYRTGAMWDMSAVTAHRHSSGSMPATRNGFGSLLPAGGRTPSRSTWLTPMPRPTTSTASCAEPSPSPPSQWLKPAWMSPWTPTLPPYAQSPWRSPTFSSALSSSAVATIRKNGSLVKRSPAV
ncbi:hypothetical protein [Arthrobacter alpinus]|uniref:hypothetical protein n=1 Tax=Arthrobacter alpinus TaxID=656366 RepID=UPI000A93DF0E|nr:hypothetical protein [Arthrobacter alpinus]